MLLILNIIGIMTLQNVEVLHAVFYWTINGRKCMLCFFCLMGETCISLKLIFPPFSVLLLLRIKKFVLIAFLFMCVIFC